MAFSCFDMGKGTWGGGQNKAWGCFHKSSHVLLSTASLKSRLLFWEKPVGVSLLWLSTCQRQQVRRMLKTRRKPVSESQLEPWLEWQIRSYKTAIHCIDKYNVNVYWKAQQLKRSWAGHIIRFGRVSHVYHPVKSLVLWRPKDWWVNQDVVDPLG